MNTKIKGVKSIPYKNSTAIIMAGGKSKRMPFDKRFLKIHDTELLKRVSMLVAELFPEIIISTSFNSKLTLDNFKIVKDKTPNRGPLEGILAGLRSSSSEINFIIASDIPEISKSFIDELYSFTDSYEIVVPISDIDKFEPLFAFYNKSIIPEIEKLLNYGENKIIRIFDRVKTKFIKMEENNWYYNLNTITDYNNYLRSIK